MKIYSTILLLFIGSLSFAGNPYKKVNKSVKKIEKLESKRKYYKAFEKSRQLLDNPFATIKPKDKIYNYLNHAELDALLFKQFENIKPYLDSAYQTALQSKKLSADSVALECAKIAFLCFNYKAVDSLLQRSDPSKLATPTKEQHRKASVLLLSKQGYYKSAIDEYKNHTKSIDELFLLQRLYAEYGNRKTAKNILAQIHQKAELTKSKYDDGLYKYASGLMFDATDQVLKCNSELDDAIDLFEKSKAPKPREQILQLEEIYDYATLSNWQIGANDKKKITKNYWKFLKKAYSTNSIYNDLKLLTEIKTALIAFEYEEAIQLLEENRTNLLRWQNPAIARSYYQLSALAHSSNKNFEELDTVYQLLLMESTACFEKESPNYNSDVLDYAIYKNEYQNKPLVALEAFETAYEKYIKPECSTTQSQNQYYLDKYEMLLLEVGQGKKAEIIATASLHELEKQFGKNSLFYGNKLERIAEIQIKKTLVKKALSNLDEVYRIYQANRVVGYDLAHVDKTMCSGWIQQGNYRDAQRLLGKAQKAMSEAVQDYDESNDIIEFADIYLLLGKMDKVKTALYSEQSKIKEIYGEDHKRNIKIASKLSDYHLKLGEIALAQKQAEIAVDLSQNIYGKLPVYAEALKKMADILLLKGDHQMAKIKYRESFSILNEYYGEQHLAISQIEEQLALLNFNYDADTVQTEKSLLKSLSIAEENIGAFSEYYIKSLIQLCNFYLETNNYAAAQKYISRLDNSTSNSDVRRRNNIHQIDLLVLEGKLAIAQNSPSKAIQKFSKANARTKSLFSEQHPLYRSTLSNLSKAYYQDGNVQKAVKTASELSQIHLEFVQTFFNSLSEREKTKYWQIIKSDFEFFYLVAFEYAKQDASILKEVYNINLSTKALLLNNSIKLRENILNSENKDLIADYKELIFKKEELLAINTMSQEEINGLNISLEKFEKEILQLERKVNEEAGNYTEFENPSWEEVKKELKRNEYAVEIIRFRSFEKEFTDSVVYAALILDHDKKTGINYVLFERGSYMEKQVFNYYRNTRMLFLNDPLSYNTYWKPLEQYIDRNSTVYFSPEGVYSLINPETLEIDKGVYVIDYFDIHTLTNTKEILQKKEKLKQENKSISIVANPSFYPENYQKHEIVAKLPGTALESESITAIVKNTYATEVLNQQQAIETEIKKIDNPTILHFATHGYFKPQKNQASISALNIIQDNSLLKSGLVLTQGGEILDNYSPASFNVQDGLLTSYEVLNMKLDQTDLVILSACETGLGNGDIGDGVFGLQKAFLVAGAENVIMSIFKVSDDVTVEFMQTYYELLLEFDDKRKALHETKKQVRLAHPEPFYWGSFVMIGK